MDLDLAKKHWSEENLPNDLFILLRNLSTANSVNIKQLYDDAISGKRKHKLSEKKKDKLIQRNIERNFNKLLIEDRKRIENFSKMNDDNFENWLNFCKTDKGREELKIAALVKFIEKKDKVKKIELLLQINLDNLESKSHIKLVNNERKKIAKLNLKRIQLYCLGNRLPPLDLYNKTSFKLDSWQIDVIDSINKGKSVLVCAPTSSGKTVLSTYFATIGKKMLYIVPSKPLALQVAAIFNNIVDTRLSIYVEDFSYTSSDPLIVIGTPYEIESKLSSLDHNFDLIVYDEVHNLNYNEGDSYERIIKLLNCNFLALSATIVNNDDIIKWWSKCHTNLQIKSVTYKDRFINIQRYLWDFKEIKKIHPLACFNKESFKQGGFNISFTPWDCYSIWKSLEKYDLAKHKEIDPEVVFQDTYRLKLNDSKDYEELVKKNLYGLNDDKIDEMLNDYYMEDIPIRESFNPLELCLKLKKKKMDPAIIFNTNPLYCLQIFKMLVENSEKEEEEKYPFHYIDLQFKHSLFLDYIKRRNSFERSVKIDNKIDKLMKFDKTELDKFYAAITENYKKNLAKLDPKNKPLDKTIANNLTRIYEKDLESTSIIPRDIFEKNENYCFNAIPMKAEEIKDIKKKISNKLGIKVQYTNILLQGLKRGIGIYTKNLPDVYLRIVQALAQKRELGIVISDDSLALGINMPFKSAVMLGWKDCNSFDDLIYQQMIGRAGRRGMDCEGNVIYANINWKVLMKSNIKKIIGHTSTIPKNYSILSQINSEIDYTPVYDNILNKQVQLQKPNPLNDYNDIQQLKKLAIWKLRKYDDKISDILDKLYDLSKLSESCNTLSNEFIQFISNIIIPNRWSESIYTSFKNKNISSDFDQNQKYIIVNHLKEVGELVRIILNIYMNEGERKLKDILLVSFNTCKLVIFNYLELN